MTSRLIAKSVLLWCRQRKRNLFSKHSPADDRRARGHVHAGLCWQKLSGGKQTHSHKSREDAAWQEEGQKAERHLPVSIFRRRYNCDVPRVWYHLKRQLFQSIISRWQAARRWWAACTARRLLRLAVNSLRKVYEQNKAKSPGWDLGDHYCQTELVYSPGTKSTVKAVALVNGPE